MNIRIAMFALWCFSINAVAQVAPQKPLIPPAVATSLPTGIWVKTQPSGCEAWMSGGYMYKFDPDAPMVQRLAWTGQCLAGKLTGEGFLESKTKDAEFTYKGQMKAGKQHGQGLEIQKGKHSEGQWVEDKLTGKGRIWNDKGFSIEGDFVKGLAFGQMKVKWEGRSEYEGQMQFGDRHGFGIMRKNGASNIEQDSIRNHTKNGEGAWDAGRQLYILTGWWEDNAFKFNCESLAACQTILQERSQSIQAARAQELASDTALSTVFLFSNQPQKSVPYVWRLENNQVLDEGFTDGEGRVLLGLQKLKTVTTNQYAAGPLTLYLDLQLEDSRYAMERYRITYFIPAHCWDRLAVMVTACASKTRLETAPPSETEQLKGWNTHIQTRYQEKQAAALAAALEAKERNDPEFTWTRALLKGQANGISSERKNSAMVAIERIGNQALETLYGKQGELLPGTAIVNFECSPLSQVGPTPQQAAVNEYLKSKAQKRDSRPAKAQLIQAAIAGNWVAQGLLFETLIEKITQQKQGDQKAGPYLNDELSQLLTLLGERKNPMAYRVLWEGLNGGKLVIEYDMWLAILGSPKAQWLVSQTLLKESDPKRKAAGAKLLACVNKNLPYLVASQASLN